MKKKTIKIGNAQAFWGDRPSAAADLLRRQLDLDYITLDYLAEVSLSILAIQKAKNPTMGYAQDLIETIQSLIPFWQQGSKVKLISNGGGLNPLGCANKCREILDAAGCNHVQLGVVDGDDVLPQLQKNSYNQLSANLDTEESLEVMREKLITANAYLGAGPIAELLKKGADIVITGRISDPSMAVAPCLADFNWKCDDYNKIAQAIVAGHLIECGSQVTGGIATDWLSHFQTLEQAADLAFPFVEIEIDGSFVITKPASSGGRVDEQTVKEQLLYEIGDPDCYLSPDAIVSFLSISLENAGKDRILVKGAKGRPPPSTYKVSATYEDGYKAEAFLGIFGPNAIQKAKLCGEIILARVSQSGYTLQRSSIECLGGGDSVGDIVKEVNADSLECVLRIAAADRRKEAIECFSREVAPLVTSGPQGVIGYTSGRPPIRQIFGYWPCLIESANVHPRIQMVSACRQIASS